MKSDEPGPGQMYAIATRQHLHDLHKLESNVKAEIRWCPAHKGVEGNEIADGANKQPDTPDECNAVVGQLRTEEHASPQITGTSRTHILRSQMERSQ